MSPQNVSPTFPLNVSPNPWIVLPGPSDLTLLRHGAFVTAGSFCCGRQPLLRQAAFVTAGEWGLVSGVPEGAREKNLAREKYLHKNWYYLWEKYHSWHFMYPESQAIFFRNQNSKTPYWMISHLKNRTVCCAAGAKILKTWFLNNDFVLEKGTCTVCRASGAKNDLSLGKLHCIRRSSCEHFEEKLLR